MSLQTQQLTNFINLVPKNLRKYIKHGIFIIPTEKLISNYQQKKIEYLDKIKNTKSSSVNSMHKYTSINPISNEDISKVNQYIRQPLNQYYKSYIKHLKFNNQTPQLFASFAITYNTGHKGLNLHTDDSIYTINFCLSNSSTGNAVVFNQTVEIEPIEDYSIIHSGNIPHHTQELINGERVNIIIWFK